MKATSKNVVFVYETTEHKECNDTIVLLETWKENADFILNWADNILIQTDTPKDKFLVNSFS